MSLLQLRGSKVSAGAEAAAREIAVSGRSSVGLNRVCIILDVSGHVMVGLTGKAQSGSIVCFGSSEIGTSFGPKSKESWKHLGSLYVVSSSAAKIKCYACQAWFSRVVTAPCQWRCDTSDPLTDTGDVATILDPAKKK